MNNKENLERLLQDVKDACALSEGGFFSFEGTSSERSAGDFACPENGAEENTGEERRVKEDEDYISICWIFETRTPPNREQCGSKSEENPEPSVNTRAETVLDRLSMGRRPVEDDHKTTVGRVFYTAGYTLLSLLVLCVVGGYVLCAHSLRAMVSIRQVEVNANAYSMVYSGDYGFDEFLQQGGASSDEELMDYLSRRFSGGMIQMPRTNADCAPCTDNALSARNSRRLEGSLVGRTLNCGEELLTMVVATRMDHGRETVSTVDLRPLGYTPCNRPDGLKRFPALASAYLPLDGMNSRGLVVVALATETDNAAEDTGRPDLTATTAVRLLLNRAESADEAVDLLGCYDIFPSFGKYYDFMISDNTGRSLVVSTAGNTVAVTESSWAVNNGFDTPLTARRRGGADSSGVLGDTYAQYDGHMTKPQMFSAMCRTVQSGDGWLVVYDTGRLTAEYCFDRDFDRQYAVALN